MNNYKRGIAVVAVLVVALSSLFAIQTVNLKSASSVTSNITSASVSKAPDYGITFKAGLALVSTSFQSPNIYYYDGLYNTYDNLRVSSTSFGLNLGVTYNRVFADITFGFGSDAKLNGFGFSNDSIKDRAKEINGKSSINFFSISAGYLSKLRLGSLGLNLGYGLVFNRGAYKVSTNTEKLEITMSNYGLSVIVDVRYMINSWGVVVGINPQITIFNSTKITATETSLNGSDQRIGVAIPFIIGAVYTM